MQYKTLGSFLDVGTGVELLKQLNKAENLDRPTDPTLKACFLKYFLPRMERKYGLKRVKVGPKKTAQA